MEATLAALTHETAQGSANDHQLFNSLSGLSAELGRLVASTRYRMSATNAYAQLAADRSVTCARARSLGIRR